MGIVKTKRQNHSIIPISFTVFLDLLGVGIVIPLLGVLFLDPSSSLLPAAYSKTQRTFLLGMVIGVYPIAQFFGAPMLGSISDKIGRRKVLIISLFGTVIGYLLFAFGIMNGIFPLLIIGRLIDGFTGGNTSVAMSSIADISDKKSKAGNFGIMGMAMGMGFVLGPFIGGKLGDSSVVSWFNYSTPFLFASLLAMINIILVFLWLPETLHERRNVKITPFTGFANIYKAFTIPSLRTIFIINFLINFGFSFFAQFFQVYLIVKFSFDQSQIGNIFAFIGLWIVITQGLIARPLSRRINPLKMLSFSPLLLAATFFIIIIPKDYSLLYFIIPFVAVFHGLNYPNITSIISNLSDKSTQGEILGINQSMLSVAQALPPLIAGVIVAIHPSFPIIAGSILTFAAWLIFLLFFRPAHKNMFDDDFAVKGEKI